jgi:hypothetical protein
MGSLGVKKIYIGDMKPLENVTITLKVTGLKVLRVRLWLGRQLLKLSAKVLGCGFKIDD